MFVKEERLLAVLTFVYLFISLGGKKEKLAVL